VLESISPAGIPAGTSFKEFEVWTASLIRRGIEAIAPRAGEDPEALLEVATRSARYRADRANRILEELERDLKMSRKRLLPNEKTLEKVARYEAHLSRQLYKATHKLAVLQTRRSGGVTPLAKLDGQGVEG